MTKQGYSAEQIDDVIASEVMQEEAKETAKEGEKEADKEKQGDYASMKSGLRNRNHFYHHMTILRSLVIKICFLFDPYRF